MRKLRLKLWRAMFRYARADARVSRVLFRAWHGFEVAGLRRGKLPSNPARIPRTRGHVHPHYLSLINANLVVSLTRS